MSKYSSVGAHRGRVPALRTSLVGIKGLALDKGQDREGQEHGETHHGLCRQRLCALRRREVRREVERLGRDVVPAGTVRLAWLRLARSQ